MKTNVTFCTYSYRASHCKEPKGYGVWWFEFEGREFHSPSGTYTEAKKACVAAVRAAAPADYSGTVVVKVMP